MEATVVDLRYKTKEILKALERNEPVSLLYHGKVKGVILARVEQKHHRVKDHPFFGMSRACSNSVDEHMSVLRRLRYS